MKIKNVAAAATALTAALVLSGCGGGADPAPAAPAAPPPAAPAAHNDADVAFAQGMIPHHEQAVTMSQLAADRAGSDEVRGLAAAVERAQGPEIARMQGFLQRWGAPGTGDMAGMDHGSMDHGAMGHGSGGMMTPEQMQQLQQAGGAEFDRMWLQMMIAHHEGAVQMAQTELRDGADAEAQELARSIVDAQQAEITQMRGMLG